MTQEQPQEESILEMLKKVDWTKPIPGFKARRIVVIIDKHLVLQMRMIVNLTNMRDHICREQKKLGNWGF